MDKPITMVIEETKNQIVEVANQSNLPIWVLNNIMKDMYEQTDALAKMEHQKSVEEYTKSLEEE